MKTALFPASSTPREADRFRGGSSEGRRDTSTAGLTIEDVAAHFEQIRDEAGYDVMNEPAEEVGQVLAAVTGTTTAVN